jgi:uncharacterized protein
VQPQYIDYWRNQQARQTKERQVLTQQAWQEVRAIVMLLKQDFGATQIILFGSLLSDRFDAQSDIDMVVAGIPAEAYFVALSAVNRLSDRWVDLKPLEALDANFRDRVLATGQVIDETD